jgi:ribonuclease-3
MDISFNSPIVTPFFMTEDNSTSEEPTQIKETSDGDSYEFLEVERRIGYQFRDRNLIRRAFTHRSAQRGVSGGDYERLEFLGDAVFDLAIAHLLVHQYEGATEGALSKMRAALVRAQGLAAIAREIGLGSFIIASRNELANGVTGRDSILADVLEALIGATYLDGGFEAAFVVISVLFKEAVLNVSPRDPKTELQELLHASSRGASQPVYKIESTEGPEHAPIFVVTVEIDGDVCGRGRGSSKKSAEQAAAEEALLAKGGHLVR